MKHITIYHVLSAKTGEQQFEQRTADRSTDDARGRALEWAAAHIDEGQPVTIWKTSRIDEENANVDLPDTAAQDSASKSNSPAVSG